MIRSPRSAAIPPALTFLVLTGLTLAVADFKPIRVRILKVKPTGATAMRFLRGDHPSDRAEWQHEFRAEGIAEEGVSMRGSTTSGSHYFSSIPPSNKGERRSTRGISPSIGAP